MTAKATFGEVAKLFMDERAGLRDSGQIRTGSYNYHEEALRLHVLPTFERRQVRSITPDDLTRWITAHQAKGYAAWSVKRHWGTLRSVLGYAARHGYAPTNVADLLTRRERPSNGSARIRYLEATEIDKLLARVDGRDKLAVMLCTFCGLRLGEMLGLRWCDVSFEEGLIRVTGQIERATGKRVDYAKTKAGIREPVLMKGLATALKAHKLAAPFSGPLDYVIASDVGSVMDRSNLRRSALQKPCKAAGITGVGFHVLRHTFASILISQGQDAIYVADQMGHENPSITLDVYGHLFARARNAETHRDRLDADFGHLFAR